MIDGPGGTKLLKAPAKFACADLVIGAKFLKSPSKGGAYSVEAVRIENGETHGSIPRVLHPNGHQWVYDTVRVGCGHTYTERYVVKLGNKAPRPVKRVEFTFTVAKAQ
jgi:hypothetical protein